MTPWTVAHKAPLSMEFSRQEFWSQLPFPTPGDLPDPGIEPACLVPPAFGRAMPETQVLSLGQEDPLEKRMATHSSVLGWRIPWTEEPCGP